MSSSPAALSLTRREAIRRILAATAVATTLNLKGFAAAGDVPGLGFDPNLLKKEIPWPRILTDAEKRIVTALADVILPADEFGPAASALGVPDFIDEWVSAPYETQVRDRKVIREGLAWCDDAARKRFGKGFADCDPAQQTTLVESMAEKGSEGRGFFSVFRDRACGAYFSTPEGWKAIGYTGNMPMAEFPGPPPEALRHIGLA
jgi:hypothetical protein